MLLNTLSCEPVVLDRDENLWSGRRESDPRPTAWKAVTLPLSYSRPTVQNVNLELTERLELSTSPLPRECSTTELRQHSTNLQKQFSKLLKLLTLQSYRERSRPSM